LTQNFIEDGNLRLQMKQILFIYHNGGVMTGKHIKRIKKSGTNSPKIIKVKPGEVGEILTCDENGKHKWTKKNDE
jgi:hypothetical protein